MMTNPFDQLVNAPRTRLPKMPSTTLVIDGKRITDVRQIKRADRELVDWNDAPDDFGALEERNLRKAVQAAKAAAKYQAARLDPAKMAKRAAWYQANKAKVLDYKKKWDARNLKKLRQQKLNWQQRAYNANPEKFRVLARAYYARNRERILAGLAAKAAAKKAAGLAKEATHG